MRTLLAIDGLGPSHFLAGDVAGPPEGFVGSPEPATPLNVEERKKATPGKGRKGRRAAAAADSSSSSSLSELGESEEEEEEDEELVEFLKEVKKDKGSKAPKE